MAGNVFDIKEFGAVGNGVQDDTAAIRAAIEAAAPVCGTVFVPPGRYLTGKQKLYPRMRLEGKSAWSFRSFGASEWILKDGTEDCLLDITGAFGCTISGIGLNGQGIGSAEKPVHGVKLEWPQYNGGSEEDTPTIDDCRIGYFSGDAVHLKHIWCFSVRHSMLCHCGGAGLYMDGWDGFLSDNWFSGNGNCGILAGPCACSVTATGNRVEWNKAAGFKIEFGDAWNITGNFFDRSYGPAVWLGTESQTVKTCAITGNIFRRSGKPEGMVWSNPYQSSHVLLQNARNITLTGNSMEIGRDDGDFGTFSPLYGIAALRAEDSVIASNSMWHGSLKQNLVLKETTGTVCRDNVGKEADEVKN